MSEFDIPAAPAKSRQVVRAKARRQEKEFRKHRNENVLRRNKTSSRKGVWAALTRHQYRKYMSNSCPRAYQQEMAKWMASTLSKGQAA